MNETKTGGLNVGVRISYGLGDTACNIVFGMISALLTLFYTDYAGVAVATVGLAMLVSRVFDGFSDVIMGDGYPVCCVCGFDVLCTAEQQHDSILVHLYHLQPVHHRLLHSNQRSVWYAVYHDDTFLSRA